MYKLSIDMIDEMNFEIRINNDNISINNIENYIYEYIKKYDYEPEFIELYEVINQYVDDLDFFNLYKLKRIITDLYDISKDDNYWSYIDYILALINERRENIFTVESILNEYIVKNFDLIFPKYTFVNKEVKIDKFRIDILAKEIELNRDVIIELKINNKNTTSQLLQYSEYFSNPILVSVNNGKVKNKCKDIIYYRVVLSK